MIYLVYEMPYKSNWSIVGYFEQIEDAESYIKEHTNEHMEYKVITCKNLKGK